MLMITRQMTIKASNDKTNLHNIARIEFTTEKPDSLLYR